MTTLTSSSPVYFFSSEKILKSLKRFNITVSKIDLDNLIKDSYSVQQVTAYLIRRFNPTDLIALNLYKFIEQYWEKNFSFHWPIEKIIQEMIPPLLEEDEEEERPLSFGTSSELFYRILSLETKMDFQSELDNKTDFYKELVLWIPKFLQSFQNLDIDYKNQDIWTSYADIESFISKYFTQFKNGEFIHSLKFIKATLLYNTKSKAEAFAFLDSLNAQNTYQGEILLHKANLVEKNFDETILLQLLLDIQIYVTKEELLDSYVLTVLTDQLDNLKLLTSLYQTKIESTLQIVIKKIEKRSNSKAKTIPDTNLETIDLEQNEDFDWSKKNAKEFIWNAFDKFFNQPELNDQFDKILKGLEPINLAFGCLTCGITYDKDLKKILIPVDLSELRRTKTTLEDNGIILFGEEITCPVCSSFKFILDTSSFASISAIMFYIKKLELEEDDEYPFGEMSNPVVIGNFKSNIVKEAKTIPDAIKKISELLKENPNSIKYLIGKGNMLLWMNDYNEARKIFRQALEIDPNNIEVLFNLIKISYARKNKSLTEKYANQLIEIISENKSLILGNSGFIEGLDSILHNMRNRKIHKKLRKEIHAYLDE